MRVAKQGDFDGFCGLYALVNCLDVAGFKQPRNALHAELFSELVHALGAAKLLSALNHGLDAEDLETAASIAFRWLSDHRGVKLNVDRPYAGQKFQTADEFWFEARERVEAGEGLILSVHLPGGKEHWTVPSSISTGKLTLRDSAGITSLALWRFKLNHSDWRVIPHETLVVTKSD